MPTAKPNIRLLIIDDELGFYQSFRAQYQAHCAFETASDVTRGLQLIDQFEPDVILLDLQYSGKYTYQQGLSEVLPLVVNKVQRKYPILVATSAKEKRIYQRAIEQGASACLPKSSYDPAEWHQKIVEIIEAFHIHTKADLPLQYNAKPLNGAHSDGFIAIAPTMQALKSRLKTLGEKYAHVPVLILGETGVGKEVAARYLHGAKTNAEKLPFETINLSAYSEELLFSEIFGHKKGSYTHAFADALGAFEKAQKGTLFLDEVGDITLRTQISLLNVLNDRKFRRVGSTEDIALNVHLIFATNRNLEEAIATGGFREDFYHRISDYAIQIPPLRERKEEILPLMDYYLDLLCKESNHPLYQKNALEAFSPGALEAFLNFYWPGNIRELRKTIQNLIIEVDVWNKKQIDEAILPQRLLQPRIFANPMEINDNNNSMMNKKKKIDGDFNWPIAKQTAFRELSTIEKVLRESGGRKDDAARALGLKNDQILRYKVLRYAKDYWDVFDNFPIICKLYKVKR
jgi:DNA-binding NtrC family response regulator